MKKKELILTLEGKDIELKFIYEILASRNRELAISRATIKAQALEIVELNSVLEHREKQINGTHREHATDISSSVEHD